MTAEAEEEEEKAGPATDTVATESVVDKVLKSQGSMTLKNEAGEEESFTVVQVGEKAREYNKDGAPGRYQK